MKDLCNPHKLFNVRCVLSLVLSLGIDRLGQPVADIKLLAFTYQIDLTDARLQINVFIKINNYKFIRFKRLLKFGMKGWNISGVL